MTKKFKHSGTFGDLIYGLPIMKHFGGGEFYLHLDQVNWIGQHYYGSNPNPIHQGRMNTNDFNFIKSFLDVQQYITKVDILDIKNTEISHNLDRFRKLFTGHPGNYIDIYSASFGITDANVRKQLRSTPWLTVPNSTAIGNRDIVINRTDRWLPTTINEQWAQWKIEGFEERSIFIGLPEEYKIFKDRIGWNIPYQPCKNMLEMAQLIQSSELFIGNQSVALSVAIGLGKTYFCEMRKDLPQERNECYFPDMLNGNYF